MIHPHTELRVVNPTIGYGVFATEPIPAGTITYVKDELELQFAPDNELLQDPAYREVIDKYSYLDARGHRVVSWDIAKYVNHSCNCNTISTGYGFEIAIRDIEPGEEITDDYGLFNIEENLTCYCGHRECRGTVAADDFDRHARRWDRIAKAALAQFNRVEQPLMRFVDHDTHTRLMTYLNTGKSYQSVTRLRIPAGAPRADQATAWSGVSAPSQAR